MEYDMLYNKPAPDELMHHGIKGQRWGVRRAEHYPLSSNQLSAAEKKAGSKVSISAKIRDGLETRSHDRKVKSEAKRIEKAEIKKEAKQLVADRKKASKELADEISGKVKRTNKTKKLSNEDLAASIDRLQKEKQYKELMKEVYGKGGKEYLKTEMGKAAVDAMAGTVRTTGKKIGNALATRAANKLSNKLIGENIIGLDDAADGITKNAIGANEVSSIFGELKKSFESTNKIVGDIKNQLGKEAEAKKKEADSKKKESPRDYAKEYADIPYSEIITTKIRGSSSDGAAHRLREAQDFAKEYANVPYYEIVWSSEDKHH